MFFVQNKLYLLIKFQINLFHMNTSTSDAKYVNSPVAYTIKQENSMQCSNNSTQKGNHITGKNIFKINY